MSANTIMRRIEVAVEKKQLENIRNLYSKKPTNICPKCKRKSLFITNKKGELYCVRCDKRIK